MSLTTCLKKMGAAISPKDKAAILSLASGYRSQGLDPTAAAIQAVSDQAEIAQSRLAELSTADRPVESTPLPSKRADTPQTETENFKRWSDDAPLVKAADADEYKFKPGKKVVAEGFHGTASPFDAFDDAKRGSATGAKSAAAGHWLVSSPEVAVGYAHYAALNAPIRVLQERAEFLERKAQRSGRQSDWDAANEAVEAVESMDSEINNERLRGQNVIKAFVSLKNPAVFDAGGDSFVDIADDINKFIRDAKREGRDGVVFTNLDDDPGFNDRQATHYLAFKPTQIKSAIGNNGDFDGSKPSILASKRTRQDAEKDEEPTPRFNSATEFWTDNIGKPLFNMISRATKAVIANDFLKRHGLNLAEDMPPEAQKAWREYKQDVGNLKKTVSEIADEAKNLSPEERAMVSDLVEREMKAGVTPPEAVVRMATLMTSIMRKQSQQLVETGMLSKDAADRWEGRYLPRFYQKHLLTNPFNTMLRKAYLSGIKGTHLKGRGLFETIRIEDVPAYEKMGWEVRDPEHGKKPSLKGLPEGSKVRVWRDFTPAERQKMGEVRDAMYRFARGYTDTQIDIAKGKLFDHIARTVARDDNPGGSYVLVPDTSVPGTGVKKFGNLAGKYVPGDVLSALKTKAGPDSDITRAYLKALSLWKEGKALALDTPIPTPSGWTTMGDVKIGDVIFDEGGKQCSVTFATGVQMNRICYSVGFSDGTNIVADAEHLWFTLYHGKGAVRNTQKILDTLKEPTRGDNNHSIPVAKALQTEHAELPIPAYALGAWLGDGFTDTVSMCSGSGDAGEMMASIRASGLDLGAPRVDKRTGVVTFCLRFANPRLRRTDGLQPTMRRMGLLGRKHIPVAYLRASQEQRRELLCGLMDTDGYVSRDGKCEFSTTSILIRDGIVELLRSLGYKPVAREYRARLNGKDCGASFRIKFHAYRETPVFKMQRKLDRLPSTPTTRQRSGTRQIISITPVASVPVRCIQVDSASRLYLAGDGMVPTHNTSLNPVTHVNNVVSNLVMSDLAGVNLVDPRSWKLYADTFNDYRKEGTWFKEAQKAGMFGGEWYGNEVAQWLPLPSELKDSGPRSIPGKFAMKTANALGSVRHGMGNLYRAEDQFFKLLLYKQARERGLEPNDAVTWANKFVFDYSTAAPGVTKLKNTLFPFANYSSKAVPALTFAATHYPWRIAKWIGLLSAFNLYAFNKLYGDDDDEEMAESEAAMMPDYLKGRSSFFGVPKAIRLPYDDESTGDGMYVDISRFVPLGDLFDAENQSGGVPLPAPLTPNNPIITTAIAMLANKDSFTGKDIVRESDTSGEAAQKRIGWLYRQMAPNNPLVPGSYNFNRIGQAVSAMTGEPIGPYTGLDYNGNTISPGRALAQTFGIKLRSVDFEKEMDFQIYDLKREISDLKGQKTKLKKNQSISDETLESELDKLDVKIEAVRDRLANLQDIPIPQR